MVRSIVAVIAGFVLVFVLSVGTDGLLTSSSTAGVHRGFFLLGVFLEGSTFSG
jgi:hypothetical protein